MASPHFPCSHYSSTSHPILRLMTLSAFKSGSMFRKYIHTYSQLTLTSSRFASPSAQSLVGWDIFFSFGRSFLIHPSVGRVSGRTVTFANHSTLIRLLSASENYVVPQICDCYLWIWWLLLFMDRVADPPFSQFRCLRPAMQYVREGGSLQT